MKLQLKDSLFLGFCAVFILFTRATLRLHLNIPGHSMFFTIFFLMLARSCVPYRFSATFVGFLSGMMAVVLGMGKGGPLILIKFILPALVIDGGAFLIPGMFLSFLLCALIAVIAGSSKFISTYVVDALLGMDKTVLVQHAFLKSIGGIVFGVAGSLLIPPVMRKLKSYGVI